MKPWISLHVHRETRFGKPNFLIHYLPLDISNPLYKPTFCLGPSEGWFRQVILYNLISKFFSQTSRGSGVLFYAVGGTPYHSHLTASVHNGTIKVSLGFGEEDIEITTGIDVDNYR